MIGSEGLFELLIQKYHPEFRLGNDRDRIRKSTRSLTYDRITKNPINQLFWQSDDFMISPELGEFIEDRGRAGTMAAYDQKRRSKGNKTA
jgi:hypothetical protein